MGAIPYGQQTQILAVPEKTIKSIVLSSKELIPSGEVQEISLYSETGYISKLINLKLRVGANATPIGTTGTYQIALNTGTEINICSLKQANNIRLEYNAKTIISGATTMLPLTNAELNFAIKDVVFTEDKPLVFMIYNQTDGDFLLNNADHERTIVADILQEKISRG